MCNNVSAYIMIISIFTKYYNAKFTRENCNKYFEIGTQRKNVKDPHNKTMEITVLYRYLCG